MARSGWRVRPGELPRVVWHGFADGVNHRAQGAHGRSSGVFSVQLRLSLIDCSGREEKSREVGPLRRAGWGCGRWVARVTFQRASQVAFAISLERVAQGGFLVGRELDLPKVENGRVINPPLDDIRGFEDGTDGDALAWSSDALLSAPHGDVDLAVGQLDFTIKHRNLRAVGLRVRGDEKFGSLGHALCLRRLDRNGDRPATTADEDLALVQSDGGGVGVEALTPNLQSR